MFQCDSDLVSVGFCVRSLECRLLIRPRSTIKDILDSCLGLYAAFRLCATFCLSSRKPLVAERMKLILYGTETCKLDYVGFLTNLPVNMLYLCRR